MGKFKYIKQKELNTMVKYFRKEENEYGLEVAVHNLLWLYDVRVDDKKALK